MQFTREPTAGVTVRRIDRDAIVIGETTYRQSIAVTVGGVLPEWRGGPVSDLDVGELDALLNDEPEMLVLGTGWSQARPPRELVFALARRGVGLEVMDTPAACRTFNILIAEGRRPAAIFTIDD